MKIISLPRIHADSRGLIHSELTEKIIGVFYEVDNELGHGFLESVYEQALAVAFRVDPGKSAEEKLHDAKEGLKDEA